MTHGERPPQAITLQRGGEEVQVTKLADRFTTRLRSPQVLDALRSQLQPQAVRPVARGQLVEWQVAPDRLEAALAQARADEAVQFASHVYQLVDSLRTWIYLLDQITLQFQPAIAPSERQAIADRYGLQPLKSLSGMPDTGVYQVTAAAPENPIKLANRLAALPEVLLADPNVVVAMAALYRPKDDLYSQQWHLSPSRGANVREDAHIAVESAWDLTRGSRSIVVAVSDDGFDVTHPDLQGLGKLVAPLDLQAEDAVPLPDQTTENHGTACAGLVIGEENQSGIVGVAPGCSFMPIRTTGFLDDESIEGIFEWAMDQGAAVIACSWSPAAKRLALSLRQRHALTQAATQGRGGRGCVIVFSAGNANRPVDGVLIEKAWPHQAVSGETTWLNGFAAHPDVITVSACTSLNRKAAYSNWGQHIAVTAPSNNAPPSMALPDVGTVPTGPVVQTPLPGRGMVTSDRVGEAGYHATAYTQTFGGTSSSCPLVAGVAALMLSVNPTLSAREVKQILQHTADKLVDDRPDPQLGLRYGTYDRNGHSWWFGYGRVNAHKAVLEARRRLWHNRAYHQTVDLSEAVTVSIPDNTAPGIRRALRCRHSGTVQDLYITVSLEHDFLGDVSLHLQTPSGRSVLLQGRTLGTLQTLDQQRYDPNNTPSLVWVIGEAAAGRWQLTVVDHAPGHTGRLLNWKLALALQTPTA